MWALEIELIGKDLVILTILYNLGHNSHISYFVICKMGMVLPNSLDKKWLAYASHYHINILTSISENWCLWNNSILCSKNEREQSTCLAICVFSLCLLQISLLFTSPKLITSENQHSWVCGLFESRIVSYTCLDNPLGCKHMSYSTIIAFLDLYLHWQKRCGTYFTICTEGRPKFYIYCTYFCTHYNSIMFPGVKSDW